MMVNYEAVVDINNLIFGTNFHEAMHVTKTDPQNTLNGKGVGNLILYID